MKSSHKNLILRLALATVIVVLLAGAALVYYVHRHIPAELLPDIRAALAAKKVPGADNRLKAYLEALYGPLDDPAHREHVFKDFFNPTHIRAMQILVRHSPPDQRAANIRAMANWIAAYRQNMTAPEQSDLASYFASDAGQAALQAATAQFTMQDAEYRSATSPVINQLMTTLSGLKK